MFAKVNSMGLFGLTAFAVEVEIAVSKGLPRFEIVGLADTAVQESRERIKAALYACGIVFPTSSAVINLAPADQRKNGSMHDLAIFTAILAALGRVQVPEDAAVIGEVSLNGDVRRVNGVLPMVLKAKEQGIRTMFVPLENAREAAVVEGITVYGVPDTKALLSHFEGDERMTPIEHIGLSESPQVPVPDFREMDFGIFEGLNYEEMTGNAEYQKWVDGMCRGKCPGGESMPEFIDRVFAAFDAVVREAVRAGEKQLFIAAHGGTVMALLSRCARPEKDYYDWYVKNCRGYVAHLDERNWASSPVLTEPVMFEALSALPEERITL